MWLCPQKQVSHGRRRVKKCQRGAALKALALEALALEALNQQNFDSFWTMFAHYFNDFASSKTAMIINWLGFGSAKNMIRPKSWDEFVGITDPSQKRHLSVYFTIRKSQPHFICFISQFAARIGLFYSSRFAAESPRLNCELFHSVPQ